MTAEAVGPDPEPVPAGAWRALAVGSAGFVLFGFNSTATNLAFGSIAESFSSVSEATVSWVASGFFIASAALLPLGGRLADRAGRRRIFNLGLIGFVLSALLSAVAPNVWTLIAARVVQATAAALIIPSSLAMALPEFPMARRPSAVATWAAAGPLSAALAPSTAAALLQATSWRVVYGITAPVAVVILLASYAFATDSRGDADSGRLDLAGTGLAIAALTSLVVGVSQGSNWGWTSPATWGAIVGGLVLGALFTVRSARHPTPLVNVGLFRIPEVALANVANLFMSITSLSIWLVWPLFLIRVWGYSVQAVGLAITIGPLCAGPAALLGGRLADRYGQRWLMIFGSGLATLAVVYGLVMIDTEANYPLRFAPMVACFGFGWGVSNPSMNSWALARVPAAVYGEVNAAFNTLRNLGAAVGTAAAIAILATVPEGDISLIPYQRAYLFFAVSIGLSFLTVTIGTTVVARRAGKRPTAESDGDLGATPRPARSSRS